MQSVRLADIEFLVERLSERALLLRLPSGEDLGTTLPRLGRRILEARLPAVAEVIATPGELCLVADGDPGSMLAAVLDRAWRVDSTTSREFELPVYFEPGTDWEEVERQTGLDRREYLQRLERQTLEVAMHGFLPGFTYLAGLPEDLRCARRPSPIARVEPGSVAVGGPWIGIYGLASPAGWQVLGRTPLALTEIGATPPSPLRIGDRLRLRPLEATEYERMVADRPRFEDLQIGTSGGDDDD